MLCDSDRLERAARDDQLPVGRTGHHGAGQGRAGPPGVQSLDGRRAHE